MSDIAIRVENLGKQYRIGALQKGGGYSYKSLRDSIANAASAPFRAARGLMGQNGTHENHRDEIFWALKDVSFDVRKGEIVGVIGRNGAGKSTLLKLLSRITEPTTGRVEIHGRVGSLLEVGTGFHPELTGRDNVYLNGAILGMKNAEIARNFDAIVAFAGVERFIDTPVKHYSSGMYLRLAFAVAAHLQTEVLIVDEVLAVGDAEFQKKCLGKMQEVSRGGRTVIFVSHNLTAVKKLCGSGILLRNGQLLYEGSSNSALERYMSSGVDTSGNWERDPEKASRDEIWFESVHLMDSDGNIRAEFDFEEIVHVSISANVTKRVENAQFAMRVSNHEGIAVFTTCNTDEPRRYIPFEAGPVTYTIKLPRRFLMPGRYMLTIAAHIPRVQLFDLIDDEISFMIHETSSYAGVLPDDRTGIVNETINWQP
jgi:lipopolysaccharide transport system ATP-binding protein